jgi:hypothetical protein
MKLPNAFYAEPRVRSSSPDVEHLENLQGRKLTLDTPGAHLKGGLEYYWTEAFATQFERDLACGPTGHEDIEYFPIAYSALSQRVDTIHAIACGHALGHPRFEEIFAPIFEAALDRLVKEISRPTQKYDGVIATAELSIARVRYTISVSADEDWLDFGVTALSVFEEIEESTIERTLSYLKERLLLDWSSSLIPE